MLPGSGAEAGLTVSVILASVLQFVFGLSEEISRPLAQAPDDSDEL
jgi:hypothetical protein